MAKLVSGGAQPVQLAIHGLNLATLIGVLQVTGMPSEGLAQCVEFDGSAHQIIFDPAHTQVRNHCPSSCLDHGRSQRCP
ncbi:hypothetical protein SJI00_14025 [Pseudomonas sp. RP23018S]|uniref:hypothetical protein n=1 Tax=Pseudomonas sp. RP23018S TaxID=3096037 RepID=UPI002ACA5BB0|nr:hypothetical protein [Pseudomonas sp. RP23018S]MDZ5603895.1 hypothetical protein [Pseudomonas sp. RP23018S]